jgi:phage gp36-like protein
MGNYASTAELTARFQSSAEVAYLTGDEATGTAETSDLNDVIERAESEIDSAIAMRYKTPVASASGATAETMTLLKRMTLDLAEFYLLRRGPGVSEFKSQQKQDVLDWCEKAAKGERVLTGATTWTSTGSRDPLAYWSDSTRTQPDDSGRLFTRDSASAL